MLNTTALLVALSATGLMGHNKGCGGGRMHHVRHQKVTCATVGPMVTALPAMSTCGTTTTQPIMSASQMAPGAPMASAQVAPTAPRPMASPSAPLPADPAEAVPPAPAVPAPPAPPAPPAS